MQKIVPNLWFDGNANQAAQFYLSVFTSVFADGKILNTTYYPSS